VRQNASSSGKEYIEEKKLAVTKIWLPASSSLSRSMTLGGNVKDREYLSQRRRREQSRLGSLPGRRTLFVQVVTADSLLAQECLGAGSQRRYINADIPILLRFQPIKPLEYFI